MIPKHILMATDLSEHSAPALRMAVELSRSLSARLTLLYVVEPVTAPAGLEAYALDGMPADWSERLERGRYEAVERRMEKLVKEHEESGVAIGIRVVSGLLPEAITDTARDLGADLLVLGTHGRKGVAHFFLGSVAERVVRTAHCPVLTVRPSAIPSPRT